MDRIGIFDSGIGGLTTMAEIVSLLEGGDFIYLADGVNAPFGVKEVRELYDIGYYGVKTLVQRGCNIIVLACNTLTANVKHRLVKDFPEVVIVGTEPAVLPALKDACRVALLATPATIASSRVQELISPYKGRLTSFPNPNLAGIIEKIAPDWSIMEKYLSESFSYLNDYDALVLGCTHFVFVKEIFEKIFPNIKVYDGNYGVAKRVKSFTSTTSISTNIQFFTTRRGEEDRYRKIFDKFYKKIKNGY